MPMPISDPRLALRSFADDLLQALFQFCLWFSLPLSIWLMSGWIGLVLHFQAETHAVCRMKKLLFGDERMSHAL